MTRRAVLGLLGFTTVVAACGDSNASSVAPSVATTTGSPASATGLTAPATTVTASTSAVTASAGTATTTAPTTTSAVSTAAPTTTTAPTTAATTAPPPTAAPTTTAATTQAPTSVVLGSNVNISAAVLQSDAETYARQWAAGWKFDDGAAAGTVTATVGVDVAARVFTFGCNVEGPMLAGPVAPISATVPVDSYVYANDGTFEIRCATSLGQATLSSDGGFGKFKLHIDVAGHPDVSSIDAAGVANRPAAIPMTFSITGADGSKRTGTLQARPA